MNKHCHRLVFNKARGLLMAVAENVTSRSKASGETSGNAVVPVPVRCSALLVTVRALTFGVWSALGLIMWPAIGQAQIVADQNAPANQRPTILNAPNGVPLVNIQTPSAAGVSRNTYSQFDVQQQGAILNNSRTNAQTQLGGWVQGNPWLATGTARVILNEVNSSNPSLLQGYVEVAGSSAQVVIANPAGVTCDGCGFINANRATLTTGTPILNGGNLEGYRVQGGAITITGAGLDASRADYTDLIARAVQVNAGIWANQLKVTAGANQVDADHAVATPIAGTGTAPAFAIDVAQLGGMYAGKITLVGTEAGVGVRNAGNIGASAGEVIVTAEGRLENAGRITSTGYTQIDTQTGIQNSGTIYAQANASLNTRGNIDNSGVIVAQGNTTLAATGSNSVITSTGGSVLGAGVQTDGSLGNSGALSVSATQTLTAQGQNLSGGDQTLAAQSINLSGSQTSAANLNLNASQGDINLTGATVAISQTLTANASQTLRTDQARLSATQINATAHDLSNVQGEIIQTGIGDLTLNLPGSLDNTQGRIATNSQNFRLAAATLTNTDGKLEHAGTGSFKIEAATLSGQRGQISSNGLLDLKATSATLDAASTLAGQLLIDSSTLSNQGGALIQTGTGAAAITASTRFDNTGGTLASNGATTLTVGDLTNRGGTIQAAGSAATDLQITASGSIDNSVAGNIAASGNTTVTANSLNNTQGQITSGQALSVSAIQTLTNTQGLLAANQQVSVSASQIDNTQGAIGSVQSQTSVTTTSGALNNSAGRIEAAQAVSVSVLGLNNTDGTISGSSLALNSQAQALDNTRGKLITTGAADSGTLDIQSGALNNEAGLIQAHGALAIDTHGQNLSNTNSGASGGITSQSNVNLTTGDLDNTAGYIGSTGALTTQSAAISNIQGGVLTSATQLNISGSALDNRGGQIQALGDTDISLSGTLNNTASLVRSGSTLTVSANSIINANTQGANQGIEGQSVNLNAQQVNNGSGAIRADNAITVTSGGSIDNTQGLISSGKTATLQDTHPASKTLSITNTGGTLIAGQQLNVDSASLTGDGKLLSQGDLSVKLTQNYIHTGELQANGAATLETTGTLTNQSTLLAGTALNLKAATIDNQATGTISATQVKLEATDSHTLTNRGLIDGQDTIIETVTLNNLGTGRIYGDHVAIGATTVTNDAENGVAPVIAARNRLDIGAETITNREHALIFSAGDLAIGGSLDANKQATGQATTLNNASATIEALGSLDLSASQINNTNEHFSTQVVPVSSVNLNEFQGEGSGTRYPASGVYTQSVRDSFYRWVIGGVAYDRSYQYVYTRSTTETQVQSSDPAQILAGGAMNLSANSLLNDKSRIIAGGTLSGNIGSLNNTEVAGERVSTDTGTAYHYIDHQPSGCCNDWTEIQATGYNPAPSVESIALTPTVYQQNTAPTGSGTQISALSSGNVSQAPSGANAASVTLNNGPAISPITQVAALNGNNAGGPATVVRSGGINTGVPNNSLFSLSLNSNSHYLIETDPQFANYRIWLSSDYLLSALSINPAAAQKRLGDGFYEQKLIREQVAQLTGRRFLDGYASDEAQYQALMGNAVTYAQAHQLRPGIALTAEQMAQLTSDIVWLVEKTITLPPSAGSGQAGQIVKALVPQLYVRVQDGDLQASGALIAGNSVNLNLSGDLTNSGTIAGRNVVSLTAENVKNLGGRISGNDVAVQARTDLNNIGGAITAANSLTAIAGRDLNVTSTTRTQTNAQGSRTNIDRVAGLYVTGSGGTLLAAAGRDINLDAAALGNSGAGGQSTLAAGNNLNLGTVTEAQQHDLQWDSRNYRKESSRTDIGTTIQAQGDLRLSAGNDLNAKAANITSEQGALLATAGGNVNLTAGEAHDQRDEASYSQSRGSWGSKKTVATRDTLDETLAVGSTLSGNTVAVEAGNDIKLKGSNIVSTQGTTLAAGNNITLEAATNTRNETHFRDEKKSGLFGTGGIGFTIGTRQQSTDQKNTGATATASTVGSTQGNVQIQASKTYTQTGSDVLAPQGNIDINAQRVDITEAQNASRSSTETQFRQSGLTLALTSPVISAIQTVSQMKQAASQTKDSRMQALAGATTALAAKNGYDAVQANPSQAGGVNVSISIGSSQSQSNSVQTASTAAGSTVAAGGNVNLTASGAGKDSDITIQGSTVKAGNDVTLKADGDINLLAAKNTDEQHSTNKNASASVGVSFGTSGFGVTLSGSGGRGNADGNDVTWTNTHVEAGNKLALESGGDTTMKGAVVSGKQVSANVGGNLNIESLQDTSQYDSKQQSLGGSVTIGAGVSGSLSASQSKIDSNFASVTEQSGIKAGDGGFQINVQGNTDLKGAVIASTQAAVDQDKNRFSTGGTLTTSDIQNQASYDANSAGINIGTSVSMDGKLAPGGTSAGFGKDSGNAASTTKAGISGIAGNKDARTGDTETGIGKIFDADKVQKDINAQVQITQAFGREAPKAVASFAQNQVNDLRAQARQETDTEKKAALEAEAKKWDEGGAYRVALHAATGALAGGAPGALGAGAVAGAAPLLDQLQQSVQTALTDAGANETLAKVAGQLVAQGTAAGLGSAVSGGRTAGAAMGFNVDANNRQLHPSEIQRIKELAKDDPQKEAKLTVAACALVKCYAQYEEGSAAYNTLKALAENGASDALAAERQQLSQQQGLFAYSATGLLSDKNIDALKQVNNTYQVTTRAAGAAQAGLSAAALAGEGLACTTGIGCAVALTTGTVVADYGIAGLKQAITGNATQPYGEQVLQSLGMSPQAAAYTYAALGLAPAAVEAVAVSKAVNAQAAANAWARGTYNGTSSIAYEGAVYRYTKTEWAEGTFQIYPGNVAADFRYTPPGVGGVYAGTAPKTAAAEVSSYAKADESPLAGKVLVTGNVSINNVLDLTNPAARQALGVTLDEITQVGHGGAAYATPQRLSEWARDQGYKAILAPSAQNPRGANLVTFDSMPVVPGGGR